MTIAERERKNVDGAIPVDAFLDNLPVEHHHTRRLRGKPQARIVMGRADRGTNFCPFLNRMLKHTTVPAGFSGQPFGPQVSTWRLKKGVTPW